MKLDPPSAVAEVLAYPIREIPCPLCSTVYQTPARAMRLAPPGEHDLCKRCNGVGKVFRAVSAFRIVTE